jgi:hypothetical protein
VDRRRGAALAPDLVVLVAAKEWQARQDLTHAAAPLAGIHKMHTDRGGGVREVGLAHEVVEDLGLEEALGDRQQLGFALDCQDDDPDLARFRLGVTARAVEALAGGVGELGSDRAQREVGSDYAVVVGATRCPAILGGGLTVKLVRSCRESSNRSRSGQGLFN